MGMSIGGLYAMQLSCAPESEGLVSGMVTTNKAEPSPLYLSNPKRIDVNNAVDKKNNKIVRTE
jgi:hypothetical protein